jgi:hypothetical protein
MRDAMPLPPIPGMLAGFQGLALIMGTSSKPLALSRLVVTVTDADPAVVTTVEIRDGATTLVTANLPAAANEIEVAPTPTVFVYADTELSMVVTAAGNDVMGLSGLLEVVPNG